MLGQKVKIFLAFLAFQQSGLKLLTANPANYSLSFLQTAKLQKLAPFKSQHNQLKLLRFPTPKATAEFPPILEPNHPVLKSTPFLYNKFMTETKPVKLKTQNLKTETCASSKFGQVQLGKLVRLPYIRKVSTKITNPSVSRKSLENKQPRVVRHSNKESHLFEQTQLNMLTLQEIELCNHSSKQKDHHKDTFPRISQNNPLLCREKSRDSLEGTFKDHFDPSLTKTDFLEHIRDYKLGPVIGRGTYSVVRSARNKQGKRVAIKTYLKTSLSNEDRRKNLQNEISVLESVNHPCILSYLETVQTETSLNIVSELLQISSLAEYIKTQYLKTVPQDIAKFIYKQLVKAVAYLHANDIVHRDIKLENVLVSKEFKIKIIDFGFSRQLPKENHVLYDFCGTMHYIAPEVMQREGYYGKPADIWALGVLLYRMTVGCFPFKGLNQKTLYTKVMKAELKLPFQLSSELSNLLTNLLNFDFRRRPTADQILGCDWLGK